MEDIEYQKKQIDTYKMFLKIREEQAKKGKYKNYSQDGLIDEILELENINDKLSSALESAENRIDKAIVYTKQFTNGKTTSIDEWKNVELVLENILGILKGSDKE